MPPEFRKSSQLLGVSSEYFSKSQRKRLVYNEFTVYKVQLITRNVR